MNVRRNVWEKLYEVLQIAKPTADIEVLKNARDLYGQGIIDSFDILVIVDEINYAFEIEIKGADIARDYFQPTAFAII